jgi:hypothetical protein
LATVSRHRRGAQRISGSVERGEPSLPPELLAAISDVGAGRVAIVQGAGCSVEAPTGLPVARDLSLEIFRRLREDGVAGTEDCADPEDLSQLADVIFAANGLQKPLVDRFPPDRFAHATPNVGHILAAALLRERAISSVMTLNFDLAQRSALADLGAADVATLMGPEDADRVGATNLIYLHRSIDANPEDILLRSSALEHEWRGAWPQVIAQRVLASGCVVFCGVGTSAAVLAETSQRIAEAIPDGVHVYVVDPAPPKDSNLFQTLQLPNTSYIRAGWTDFVLRLARRLTSEHVLAISQASEQLCAENDWTEEDATKQCEALIDLNLYELGCLRASWMLEDFVYRVHDPAGSMLLADLVLGIALCVTITKTTSTIFSDGVVEFEKLGVRTPLLFCSGGGHRRWTAIELAAQEAARRLATRHPAPNAAVVAGFAGPRMEVTTPPNLVASPQPGNIVGGSEENVFRVVAVDEIREDNALAVEVIEPDE